MHATSLLTVLSALILTTSALQSPHRKQALLPKRNDIYEDLIKLSKRQPASSTFEYLHWKSLPFLVNGSTIPDVPFDAGESYAGTLSISANESDANRLFFWFWPSTNPKAGDEITIWLNGGPGCSSLMGFFQENGPLIWQPGTYAPIRNPYFWTNLTNMVYIDQPIGTGFSPFAPGAPSKITNETVVASQFMGFWKNFEDTFKLHNRKVYITGESYAGQYIPYIASAMLDQQNKTYFNVQGVQIIDPSINHGDTLTEAPSVGFVREWSNLFNLNSTFMAELNNASAACGYDDFMENALKFPPKSLIPTAPSSDRDGCALFNDIVIAALYVNPCFNIYHITDYCPFLWNVMGFPSLATGPHNHFNRTDVQKAIHAPPTDYTVCGDYTLFPGRDRSVPSGLGPLPSVIDRTKNVIIAHGMLDFLLIANGSLVTIQNMTWGGKQGFQKAPQPGNFYVPYHATLNQIIQEATRQVNLDLYANTDVAGAGIYGSTHTERGLTFVQTALAGHQIPQYAPGAAYRQLEFLLGRIPGLTYVSDFTTQTGNFTENSTLY